MSNASLISTVSVTHPVRLIWFNVIPLMIFVRGHVTVFLRLLTRSHKASCKKNILIIQQRFGNLSQFRVTHTNK
jgi:hypothetical protein